MNKTTVTEKMRRQIEAEVNHPIMDEIATMGNHLFFTTVGGTEWWCKLTDTGRVKKHSARVDIQD